MKTFLRSMLAIIVGLIAGSFVNMMLITLGPAVIPPPDGVDATSTDTLSASMHLLEPKHFVFPFLAHALGTLTGSLSAFFIGAGRKVLVSYVVGTFFLLGGIAACFMIPAPIWYIVVDLVFAYIPMTWIAVRLGRRISK